MMDDEDLKLEDADELDDLGKFQPRSDDKFNQVLSSSKEGGGLLASVGLKKEDIKADNSQEEDL